MSKSLDPLKTTTPELPLFYNLPKYLDEDHKGIFLEIGSDRMEGSTVFLADLAQKNNTKLLSVDISPDPQTRIFHPAIEWHVAIGSQWCETVWPTISQPIRAVYLDNLDYDWGQKKSSHHIWNPTTYDNIKGVDWPETFTTFNELPFWIQEEVRKMKFPMEHLSITLDEFYAKYKIPFNNNQCQVEHFTQLRFLFPYFDNSTVICFDDTITINGCWIGKNGPGVIFLQSHGYEIIDKDHKSVIMKKARM
jgi:hypothetical protein